MRLLRGICVGASLLLTLIPATAALAASGPEIPVTAVAPPQPPGPLASIADLESQLLGMVNTERAAAGVAPLQNQPWAHGIAEQHSQAMAAAGTIWHNMDGYMGPGHQVLDSPYLGENVAYDSTLAAADALLFSDPPHRAITLDPRFNFVGIGIAYGAGNWVFLTEDFAEIDHNSVAPVAPAAPARGSPPLARVVAAKPAVKPAAVPVVAAPTPVPAAVPVVDAPTPAAPASPAAATRAGLIVARSASHTAPVPYGAWTFAVLMAAVLGVWTDSLLGGKRFLQRRRFLRGQTEPEQPGGWRPSRTRRVP